MPERPKGKIINLGIRRITRPKKQVVPVVPFLLRNSTNHAFVMHSILTRFSGRKNESTKLFLKLCQDTFFKEHAIIKKLPEEKTSLRANKHSKQPLETATPDFLHGVYCNWLVEGIGERGMHRVRLDPVFGFHEQLKKMSETQSPAELFSTIQSSPLAQTNLLLKTHKGKQKIFANGSIKPLIEMTPEELIGVHARWIVNEYIKKAGLEEEMKKQVQLASPNVFGGRI